MSAKIPKTEEVPSEFTGVGAVYMSARGSFGEIASLARKYAGSAGGFCPVGAVAPLLCQAGTYSDTTGNTEPSDCKPCNAGFFCGTGAMAPPP